MVREGGVCEDRRMPRFLVRVVVNAVALWLTTLIVSGTVVTAYEPGDTTATVLTYLLLGAIFGVVNGVIGTAIRIVAFPLYVLTLGLIALIVNGLLFLLVAAISDALGFGLTVEGFWWGVLGALLMAFFSWLVGLVLRPVTARS
jgi:putative membrane protein